MSNTKIGIFDVTQKINKQLTWVLAALIVLEALVCVGDYIGLVGVSRGPLVYGISRITQSGVGKVLLPIVCSYFFIHIWFIFRRSLAAVNSLLRYLVLAIIALIGCDMVLGLMPDSFSTLEQIQHPSKFTSFASSFMSVSLGLQTLLKTVLSIGLIVKFTGRIRTFARVTLVCVLLIGDGRYLYTYLYNAGINASIQGLALGMMVFKYLTVVIPVIFLRRTMTYTNVKSADGDTDIN